MDDRDKPDDQKRDGLRQATDSELSGRLHDLDADLRHLKNVQRAEQKASEPDRNSTSAGVTLAFRLGSEFAAGVLVGAGLGWALDRVLGTAPWGMIVLLLLGFGAGVMNMLRAAGQMGGGKPPRRG